VEPPSEGLPAEGSAPTIRLMTDAMLGPAATPARPDVKPRITGTWAGIGAALAFGSLTDAAYRVPPGLAVTLGTWLAVAAIAGLARPRRAAWPFLAGAAVLGAFFSLRTSPMLLVLDLLGATALLCVASSFTRRDDPATATTRSYLARAALTPFEALPDGITSLTGPPAREFARRASPRALVRAALLIAPVAAVLAILLGSADPVFRRYVHVPSIEPDVWPPHVIATIVGALALATLVAIALRPPTGLGAAAQGPLSARWVRTGEWVGLLAVVDALFAIFVVIQFAVFFEGRTRVLREQGLTYAEYARGGFWQLLGAAAIAGVVLAFVWHALPSPVPERSRRMFLGLGLGLVALVGVVLVSAFKRLALYEDAYGLTELRILVHATIVALAALFVCVIVALVLWRSAWLPTAAVVIVTVTVIGLDLFNVDARIAASNIARAEAGHGLDPWILSQLSPDAYPVMVDALDGLSPGDRASVTSILACRTADLAEATSGGWAEINRARTLASDALSSVDLPACGAVSVSST
jgi:hypothetical protein